MTRLPKAILFDHDGVLVASEPLHWAAWEKLLAELGIPSIGAEMRIYVGKTAPEIIALILDRFRPGWDPAHFDPERLALRKNDFYLASLKAELKAYPGVPEGLRWLREQGIRTAVVSNAKRRELDSAFEILGFRDLFDRLVSRDDVSAHKPDPTPYLFAAKALGFSPDQCLAVEDSPTGIESSLRAQIPSAAVLTNFARESLEHPVAARPELAPVWIGDSMMEFFSWLKSIADE